MCAVCFERSCDDHRRVDLIDLQLVNIELQDPVCVAVGHPQGARERVEVQVARIGQAHRTVRHVIYRLRGASPPPNIWTIQYSIYHIQYENSIFNIQYAGRLQSLKKFPYFRILIARLNKAIGGDGLCFTNCVVFRWPWGARYHQS